MNNFHCYSTYIQPQYKEVNKGSIQTDTLKWGKFPTDDTFLGTNYFPPFTAIANWHIGSDMVYKRGELMFSPMLASKTVLIRTHKLDLRKRKCELKLNVIN